MNIAIIGNVDSGKSTLTGQLIIKNLDPRFVEKTKEQAIQDHKDSFALARLLDEDQFEREKCITVDFAKVPFKTNKYSDFILLDCPGHELFIPKMISGISMADIAILVLSCKNGEYERSLKGSTIEHIYIAYNLGIKNLIVAVNKMDEITFDLNNNSCAWNINRYTDIVNDISKTLKNIGFKVKKDVYFIPISAFNDVGIRSSKSEGSKSLFDILDTIYEQKYNKSFLGKKTIMIIHDVYKEDPGNGGLGTCSKVTCKIIDYTDRTDSEKLYINDQYSARPINATISYNQGQGTASFITPDDYSMYQMISSEPIVYKNFLIECFIYDCSNIITNGFMCTMHLNGLFSNITIKEIYDAELRKKTFAKSKEKVHFSVVSDTYLLTSNYDELKRVLLRAGLTTIAVGVIKRIKH